MDVDDGKLIERVLAGERDQFRRLVERYQQSMVRFAFGLLGNRHEAEEVAQDAFLSAYLNLDGFDSGRSAFSTWLFTIARNRCINTLKRKRTVIHNNVNSLLDRNADMPIHEQEFMQQLDSALAALPTKQRAAFVLAEIEELPYAEIALIEKTTLGTVKSRIHRAKKQLRHLLMHLISEAK